MEKNEKIKKLYDYKKAILNGEEFNTNNLMKLVDNIGEIEDSIEMNCLLLTKGKTLKQRITHIMPLKLTKTTRLRTIKVRGTLAKKPKPIYRLKVPYYFSKAA